MVEKYVNEHGFNLSDCNVLFNLDSTESVKSMVIKGYGISFLPYISIKKELYVGQLVEKTVPEFNLGYDIYMIYKKEITNDSSKTELIKYLKKVGDKTFC